MKNKILMLLLMLVITIQGNTQTVDDLLKPNGSSITWLGIDFSHVKLIGDFSQFFDAGEKNIVEVRNQFFPKWNSLILTEPEKYDIKRMLRKKEIYYDIDMIMRINSEAETANMESFNTPNYKESDIKNFISNYTLNNKEGIGVLFIAESLNKISQEAYFHFVAINMQTKDILLQKRLRGEPSGIGLRNYWAGSIYRVVIDIRKVHYKSWKQEYKIPNGSYVSKTSKK